MSILEQKMIETCLDTSEVFDQRQFQDTEYFGEGVNLKRREEQLLMGARIKNIKKIYQNRYQQLHQEYSLKCDQLKQQLQSEIKREMYTFETNVENYVQNLSTSSHLSCPQSKHYQNNLNSQSNAKRYRNRLFTNNEDEDQHNFCDFKTTSMNQTMQSVMTSFQDDEQERMSKYIDKQVLIAQSKDKENYQNKTRPSYYLNKDESNIFKNPISTFQKMRESTSQNKRQTLAEKQNQIEFYQEKRKNQQFLLEQDKIIFKVKSPFKPNLNLSASLKYKNLNKSFASSQEEQNKKKIKESENLTYARQQLSQYRDISSDSASDNENFSNIKIIKDMNALRSNTNYYQNITSKLNQTMK